MEEKKVDYGATLHLPVTDFPMRGNLPTKEPDILAYWEKIDIYQQIQAHNAGKPKFVLHDGPPYANGDIHLGHTLNKVLKDIIVKYKSQNGFDAPYVPGWDTHGLPTELKAIKALGIDHHSEDKVAFRQKCAEFANGYVEVQKKQFQRLGVRGDWQHPYITLDPVFEAEEIGVFGKMAQKGYIYKGLKPVHWCPSCETALAEAEIEYKEKRSPSIYVKFPITDAKGLFAAPNSYVVIWTTTPWTLPGNMAVAVHPEFVYELLAFGEERYLIAKDLRDFFIAETGLADDPQVLATFVGRELEGMTYRQPILAQDFPVVLGTHVTTEQGTGCVHTAPGHGHDDYLIGQKYGLPIGSHIDGFGVLTEAAGDFAKLPLDEANKAITQWLDGQNLLLKMKFIKHQYPHCWRCESSTIFRATNQWFVSIDGFRQNALDEIDRVVFTPAWGKERIRNMVAERSDWCISRQRVWGVPIPIFYCASCDEIIVNDTTIGHLQELFRAHGSDIWYAKTADELVPAGYVCEKCGGNHFNKENDIMDVWFDSGSSHMGVLAVRPELTWPADLYLEGSDQHRGWFNSSLTTAVATTGKAPYRGVLTHGFLVDEKGRKMSKSLGNGVDPLEVIDKMGADILRLWVSSTDYRTDISVSPNILKQVSESYRKIRNTFRYLLGSVSDYVPTVHQVAYQDMEELDRWAMMRLGQLIQKVTKAYDQYEFHVVYHAIHNFCSVDMSAFYFDISKDRLYASAKDDVQRRSCQTVMAKVCLALVQMLTPIISFTAEEVWSYMEMADKPISAQLADWPVVSDEVFDEALEKRWDALIALRDVVAKPLEAARREKTIGHSLNACVTLYLGQEWQAMLAGREEELATLFIVSKVVIAPLGDAAPDTFGEESLPEVLVQVAQAPGEKCERCWMYSEEIGADVVYPTLCPRCAAVLSREI